MWGSIGVHYLWALPCFSSVSGSSNLDSFRDWTSWSIEYTILFFKTKLFKKYFSKPFRGNYNRMSQSRGSSIMGWRVFCCYFKETKKESKKKRKGPFNSFILFLGSRTILCVRKYSWIQMKWLRLSDKVLKIHLFSGRYVHYSARSCPVVLFLYCLLWRLGSLADTTRTRSPQGLGIQKCYLASSRVENALLVIKVTAERVWVSFSCP